MMVDVSLGDRIRRRRLVIKPAPRRRFAAVLYIVAGVEGCQFFDTWMSSLPREIC